MSVIEEGPVPVKKVARSPPLRPERQDDLRRHDRAIRPAMTMRFRFHADLISAQIVAGWQHGTVPEVKAPFRRWQEVPSVLVADSSGRFEE
ncbi:hypothetical protein [Amaricoccus solimangrovi]|uniref:Uncharacterized protein n=1 Tax=Amaricoccus solimangrovi TaxID=2589815 RepID=A0A501WBC0_9RHOB|nr:hypothetical protein [Amaricoccus solimangrovi]TPE45670.1 hypothetical protein FJM51_22525 [Amaricoccus solimangrovi]